MPIGGFLLAAERLITHLRTSDAAFSDAAEVAWWSTYLVAFGFLVLAGRKAPLLERAVLIFMAVVLLLLGSSAL